MVFDESSMLDLPSVYQLLAALPDVMDLLFIGDPAQLPPIGPGLVFHRMVESPDIPQVRLEIIHRRAGGEGQPGLRSSTRPYPALSPVRPYQELVLVRPGPIRPSACVYLSS